MASRILLALPAALAVAASTAWSQANPGAPPAAPAIDYALTNVRIVTAPGRVIERGTVLIRNGRIAGVGASVDIPAGVSRMDLAGHTVFPGIIDAATSTALPLPTRPVGDPSEAPAGRGGRGGGGGGGGGGRGNLPGLVPTVGPSAPLPPVVLPEVDAGAEASDMFAPTQDQLRAFRAGGVTTVGLVFNGGLFPGRVGAALTGGLNEGRLGLRSSAGQVVAFGTKRGGYPSTGIGAVAFVKQSFLDAQYEARVDKAFKAGTPGARPSNDPFTRALVPAATNEMPAWFTASTERQINRVGEIAKELGLRSPVVVGTQEGWRVIPTLKSIGATAVVSLALPGTASVTGTAFMATPDATATGNALRANAAELAKAGIPIVLASFGSESGTSFRDRIRTAIEGGLSADDALRAVTVTPATLLGISAAVGTIETGKLANLVVVTGNDLFASGTPIKHVFVEGRIYP